MSSFNSFISEGRLFLCIWIAQGSVKNKSTVIDNEYCRFSKKKKCYVNKLSLQSDLIVER